MLFLFLAMCVVLEMFDEYIRTQPVELLMLEVDYANNCFYIRRVENQDAILREDLLVINSL